MEKARFPVKGRYIVLVWILPVIYLPGINYFYRFLDESSGWYWFDVIYYYYYHTIMAVLLAALVFVYKIKWHLMLVKPDITDYIPAIKFTVFIFLFSIAAVYAFVYPLSFIAPEFVKYWYIELPPIIYSSDQGYPFIPNFLNFISLVVLAPVFEEFAFRGLLLHRWIEKWGMNNAILFSSLLFGVLHPDPIGATAFGIAMCIIYLKTQTLIVPMVCHALSNLAVWLIEAGSLVWLGPVFNYTLEDFQSEWGIGLLSALVIIVWINLYMKNEKSKKVWKLPII